MSAILEFRTAPGKPVLRGHAFFWSVIRELGANGGSVSVHAVLQRTNRTERSTVADYFRRLSAAGILADTGERETIGKGAETPLYRLVKTPLATPRLNRDGTPASQGRGQQQMWNVLRGPESRAGISAEDLALRAATDEISVTVATAKAFLKRLNGAGYLAPVRHGLWKLKPAMNSGPLPPLILRSKIVFDQNTRTAAAPVTAEEDRP